MSVKGTERPLIIPVFIPNQGCRHQCVFCDQEKITGQSGTPIRGSHVKEILDMAVASARFERNRKREVAFYGGTFAGLPVSRMRELLEAVSPYRRRGLFSSIRISTRPDSIDEKRLDLLKSLGVTTVELGAQSMDDKVLRLSRRGHSADDTVEALVLLKNYGFRTGIQLMPGLPGDSGESFLETVNEVVRLKPDMVRLYPALVIRGTELAEWYFEKRYEPLSLDAAVRICTESCIRLEGSGIPVIRMGLMSTTSLIKEGQIVAGPWHSAFGFLVRSALHMERIAAFLPRKGTAAGIGIRAPQREIALIRGHKNEGTRLIEKKTGSKVRYIRADDSVPAGRIEVEIVQ